MNSQPAPGSNPWITFDVTAQAMAEPGLADTTVMEIDKAFQVKVNFVFAGFLAPWIVSLGVPCKISVSAESIGPGPELTLGASTVTTLAGPLNYSGTVNVAAHTLTEGTYKLVAAVTIPNSPVAGFIEGPIIQMIPAYP